MAKGKYFGGPITKAEVINAVANILIRLGKGNINEVRDQILHSSKMFEQWVADRPEKNKINGKGTANT